MTAFHAGVPFLDLAGIGRAAVALTPLFQRLPKRLPIDQLD